REKPHGALAAPPKDSARKVRVRFQVRSDEGVDCEKGESECAGGEVQADSELGDGHQKLLHASSRFHNAVASSYSRGGGSAPSASRGDGPSSARLEGGGSVELGSSGSKTKTCGA